jgi:PAS domain-containing protein
MIMNNNTRKNANFQPDDGICRSIYANIGTGILVSDAFKRLKAQISSVLLFIRNDGTSFHGEVTAQEILTDDDKKRTIVFIRDISERIEAERLLRESEDHYRRTPDD